MNIIGFKNKSTNNPENKSVLALGNFDGVHIGHKKLISRAVDLANECKCNAGIYTFDINSKKYLGNSDLYFLTTNEEKNKLFSNLGVDFVCYDNFNEIKNLTPDDFCKYLVEKLNVCGVVCGENFRFGKNACAGAGELSVLMEKYDAFCETVPLLYVSDECVSSSAIRQCIQNGNVEKAGDMLGYRYYIETEVSHGAKLGRTLGFPTINQFPYSGKVVPKFGVYACVCLIDNKKYMSVTNVGIKPTVTKECDNPTVVFESHIIDYSGDLYGKTVRIEFCCMLREEKKFSSLDELKTNVFLDIEKTNKLFSTCEIAL